MTYYILKGTDLARIALKGNVWDHLYIMPSDNVKRIGIELFDVVTNDDMYMIADLVPSWDCLPICFYRSLATAYCIDFDDDNIYPDIEAVFNAVTEKRNRGE